MTTFYKTMTRFEEAINGRDATDWSGGYLMVKHSGISSLWNEDKLFTGDILGYIRRFYDKIQYKSDIDHLMIEENVNEFKITSFKITYNKMTLSFNCGLQKI